MQDFSKQVCLLNEFYNRHKLIIDALAKEDEMFRAIKEISESKEQPDLSTPRPEYLEKSMRHESLKYPIKRSYFGNRAIERGYQAH